MTLLDRLRAIPPRHLAMGGAAAVALLVVIVMIAASTGGADRIESTDPGVATSAVTTTVATSATTPSTTAPRSTTSTTSTVAELPMLNGIPFETVDIDEEYELDVDDDDPAVAGRGLPDEPDPDEPPPVTIAPPPWAASTTVTEGGHVGTEVGCADDMSVQAIDRFFSSRVGPVLGWDYQHVYPMADDKFLWLFQDTFLDHSGTVTTLTNSRFVHNAALVQDGPCFTLLHRGTAAKPTPFELGDGSGGIRTKWFWPMGGELVDDELQVFWVEMEKDPYDPDPPDGLGWHPRQLFLATYDAVTLERIDFAPAYDSWVDPMYGYAVSSDQYHTYLFGNSFEQNMVREGGFWNGPHSATQIWLARVPRGRLDSPPEYRTIDGWSFERGDAMPIVARFYAENPMQPRYLDGQWVSVTAVDGYWGDQLAVDVAPEPWGPWTTVQFGDLHPRNADPKMNTYHAHLLPWRDGFGSLQISVSNNARNMRRDAYPHPERYRPNFFHAVFQPTPGPTTTTTTTTTTAAPTTTTTAPPTTTTTTTTTLAPTTTTTAPTTTITTVAPTTTTSSTSTTTTAAPTTTTTAPPTTTTTTVP